MLHALRERGLSLALCCVCSAGATAHHHARRLVAPLMAVNTPSKLSVCHYDELTQQFQLISIASQAWVVRRGDMKQCAWLT